MATSRHIALTRSSPCRPGHVPSPSPVTVRLFYFRFILPSFLNTSKYGIYSILRFKTVTETFSFTRLMKQLLNTMDFPWLVMPLTEEINKWLSANKSEVLESRFELGPSGAGARVSAHDLLLPGGDGNRVLFLVSASSWEFTIWL